MYFTPFESNENFSAVELNKRLQELEDKLNELKAMDLMPVGSVMPFSGSSIPNGWVQCDGGVVSRFTYSSLFSVIGTTFGIGDGSTNFGVPSMNYRTPIGAGTGSGLTARTLGTGVGTINHVLTLAQTPSHIHSGVPWTTALTNATVGGGTWLHSPSVSSDPAGGGGSHNNTAPSIVTRYIIKAS